MLNIDGVIGISKVDTEWAAADGGWVAPTSAIVAGGGGTATWGFRIILATGGVQHKVDALLGAGRPVVDSVPGYVLATDMTTAALYVHPPASANITSATVVNDAAPAGGADGGAAGAAAAADSVDGGTTPCMTVGAPTRMRKGGGMKIVLTPTIPHCRCRVELRYTDGTFQVVSYYILPPLDKHLAAYGAFQAKTAYYDDDSDPFGRSPSVMPWNRAGKCAAY